MKKPLFYLLMLGITSVSAQSWKNKPIDVPMPSYAKYVSPEGIKDFAAAPVNVVNAGLPFTEEELKAKLSFQEFDPVAENGDPDLFFGINGVKPSELDINVKRSKKDEVFYITILPTEDAKISVLTLAKGENTHISDYSVAPNTDTAGKPVAESFEIPFAEIEKYLIIKENGDKFKFKGTPYLVHEYLKRVAAKDFLENRLIRDLQKAYDNRVNIDRKTFYAIKNKKNPEIEAETKANLVLLEETFKDINTLEKLRANKSELQPFKDFWTAKLADYDASSKDGKKVTWGILMNLYRLSMMGEDYEGAKNYADQIVAMDYKKWISKAARSDYRDAFSNYNANFNSSGERNYVTAYKVDPILSKIARKDAAKAQNFKDTPGYVIKKGGERLEGKIAMNFSQEAQGGSVVSLDGDTTAKRVFVTYVNAKGKTRTTALKCKEVEEIVVDNRTFEPVNPKKSILNGDDGALGLSLNNTVFMERLYNSDQVKLFKDLTASSEFYFEFPNVKKAQVASEEVFASCGSLAQRIANKEFAKTDEDQKKIAEIYANGCEAK